MMSYDGANNSIASIPAYQSMEDGIRWLWSAVDWPQAVLPTWSPRMTEKYTVSFETRVLEQQRA
jgi:hypothetical protein